MLRSRDESHPGRLVSPGPAGRLAATVPLLSDNNVFVFFVCSSLIMTKAIVGSALRCEWPP